MNRFSKLLGLSAVVLLLTTHRLPAPISEVPETTPTPKPKREATPRLKAKPEATPKPTATSNRSFAGTWTGSAGNSSGSAVYVIKISDDEKTVWINWNKSGKNITGSGLQAPCNRFRETLTWSITQQVSIETDTLRMNANGTASFVRKGNTYNVTGTLSRQDFSSAPSVSQTTTLSPQISGWPTAKPVPGKPGYVFNPFVPDSYVDVQGFPSGTVVKDPYSNKLFIVP